MYFFLQKEFYNKDNFIPLLRVKFLTYNKSMNMTLIKKIGDYEVIQRTDGMINASEFLKCYNETAKVKKRMDVFFRMSETKAFVEELKTEGVDNPTELVKEKQEGCRPMKRTWWFCPMLFMDFAMWLDVRMSVMFIKHFKDKSFDKTPEGVYMNTVKAFGIGDDSDKCERIIKGLDFIVFGKYEPDMWLNATDEQRNELYNTQAAYMFDIYTGSMNFDDYIKELQVVYKQKIKQV